MVSFGVHALDLGSFRVIKKGTRTKSIGRVCRNLMKSLWVFVSRAFYVDPNDSACWGPVCTFSRKHLLFFFGGVAPHCHIFLIWTHTHTHIYIYIYIHLYIQVRSEVRKKAGCLGHRCIQA